MDNLTKLMIEIYRRKLKETAARHGTTSIQALQVSRYLDGLVLVYLRQTTSIKQKASDIFES